MRRAALVTLALVTGCNQLFGLDAPAGDDGHDARRDAGDLDAAADAAGPRAWTVPVVIPVAATAEVEDDPVLMPDGRELVFAIASGHEELMSTRMPDGVDQFPPPEPIRSLNTLSNEGSMRLSYDPTSGHTGYFTSDRSGMFDIWITTRAIGGVTWSNPVRALDLASSATDATAAPCANRSRFAVSSDRGGASHDLYEILAGGLATRIDITVSPGDETGPFLTDDCLHLYYASNTRGTFDLYVIHRQAVGAPWTPPELIADLSTTGFNEGDPWLSSDRTHILFATDRDGSFDIVEAFALPRGD